MTPMTALTTLMSDILAVPAEEIVDELSMIESDCWDSLQHMEIVISIEQTFQIDLTADEIVDMTSVGAIKDVLVAKGV